MQLQGAWPEALEEADRAGRALRAGGRTAGRREVRVPAGRGLPAPRRRSRRAEEAYRRASQHGLEPQPGWSLLRLAQGKADAAATAIRRVLGETTDSLQSAGLLPAYVEIMLQVGELEEARRRAPSSRRSPPNATATCCGRARPGARSRRARRRQRAGALAASPPGGPGLAGARGAVRGCARPRARRACVPRARRRRGLRAGARVGAGHVRSSSARRRTSRAGRLTGRPPARPPTA